MEREQVLERVRAMGATLRELGFGKLYLFGSVARGEADPNDVDLLFEPDPDNDPDLFRIWRVQDQLAELLGRPVDLVDRKLLHQRIRSRVEAEMVEVY